jgi:galactose mutarotase-like enzyme
LPIHGALRGAPFDVIELGAHRLHARLDYGADPERARVFPFPHLLDVDVRLDRRRLRITTSLVATGDGPVPASFCWHPYLRLPGGRRRDWLLRWPACEHVEVDERLIPTGRRRPQSAQRAPLGTRTFDDHYALARDRRFSISDGRRTLTLRFDDGYPYAQLYVPPRGEFVAIEPMTARIDALSDDDAPLCRPGDTFRAAFTMSIDTAGTKRSFERRSPHKRERE